MALITDLLLSTSVLALWLLLLGGAGFGLLAALAPATALRLQRASARGISTRRALKWAEWPHQIERHFYRHHRLFGMVLLALSVFALWVLITRLPGEALVRALSGESVHRLWIDVLVTTIRALLITGLVVAVATSLVVIFRPSLLKRAEQGSNRWLSTRRAMRRLEHDHQRVNRWFERHPRLSGLLVAFAALTLALLLWPITQQLIGE